MEQQGKMTELKWIAILCNHYVRF